MFSDRRTWTKHPIDCLCLPAMSIHQLSAVKVWKRLTFTCEMDSIKLNHIYSLSQLILHIEIQPMSSRDLVTWHTTDQSGYSALVDLFTVVTCPLIFMILSQISLTSQILVLPVSSVNQSSEMLQKYFKCYKNISISNIEMKCLRRDGKDECLGKFSEAIGEIWQADLILTQSQPNRLRSHRSDLK